MAGIRNRTGKGPWVFFQGQLAAAFPLVQGSLSTDMGETCSEATVTATPLTLSEATVTLTPLTLSAVRPPSPSPPTHAQWYLAVWARVACVGLGEKIAMRGGTRWGRITVCPLLFRDAVASGWAAPAQARPLVI